MELEGGEHVYGVGCAARVLQVSRSPSRERKCVTTPTRGSAVTPPKVPSVLTPYTACAHHRLYVLLLEGRVRCQVHQVSAEGPFFAARVSPSAPLAELDVQAPDPEVALLATAFRDAARTLVERCVPGSVHDSAARRHSHLPCAGWTASSARRD